MNKTRIIFYTDCYIFAGCERPLFELLSADDFSSKHDYKIFYRTSSEYEDGLKQTYPNYLGKIKGVHFPDPNTGMLYFDGKLKNGLFRKILKKLCHLAFRLFELPIFFFEVFTLTGIFKKESAGMVHINNGGYPGALSCRAAAVAARLAGKKKVIFSVHNIALKQRGITDRMIDHLVGKSVTTFVTGSRSSGFELSLKRGFDRNKMTGIYHGIEPVSVKENITGSEYQSDLLMVAVLEERKGHAYVISAIKKLIDERPELKDLKIKFVGGGHMRSKIEKMVVDAGLAGNIQVLGHRKDFIKFVASTKILLNPSVGYEDLPFVIIEAMSLGVPVIGSDVAGIPEEIENGVNGIIVKPKDVDSLKESINELLSDENKRASMGREGSRIFSEKFTLDKMVKNYIELYMEG